MRFRRRRRVVLLLGIAIVASGLSLLIRSNHFLRRPEQQAIDARFQIRGAEPGRTAGFVIVGIDGRTFSDFNNQGLHSNWPLLRRYDARVIDRLRRAGAKLIAFDLQFTEQTDVSDDNALIEAVGRAHNMVLSTTDVGPHGTTDVLGGDALLLQARGTRGRHERRPGHRWHDPHDSVLDPGPQDVRCGGCGKRDRSSGACLALRRPEPSRAGRLRRSTRHGPNDLVLPRL